MHVFVYVFVYAVSFNIRTFLTIANNRLPITTTIVLCVCVIAQLVVNSNRMTINRDDVVVCITPVNELYIHEIFVYHVFMTGKVSHILPHYLIEVI